MKKIILITLAGLLIGGLCGYLIGYLIYVPQIEEYVNRVNDLTNEVSDLVQRNSNLEQTNINQEVALSTQQTRIEGLENETTVQKQVIADKENRITSLRLEKNTLQDQLSNAETEIENLEDEVLNKKKELFDVKAELDGVLNIRVTQHYQWVYGGRTWDWDLPISIWEYKEFSERPRPFSTAQFVNMATDPKDDYYIDSMVEKIEEAASERRYNAVQKLNFVISFVQSLPYTVDEETTPYDEYPRYPLETLFDRGGDCEDTSILVAALLDRTGYDIVLLHLEGEKHMAVGVNITGVYGTYYEYNGKNYFYVETTGEGRRIGDFPTEFKDTRAYIYPVR